jgi:exosortase A
MDHVAIHTSTALTGSTIRHKALRAWLPSVIALAIVSGAFGVAFWTEITAAVRVWMDSTAYNHCFLVLPLIGILLWARRRVVANAHPSSMPGALLFLPGLALLWSAAALLDVLEAEQLLVVALFEVLVLAILGWRLFRALLAPALFLFFLVPFGAFLVPTLQRFTAAFATSGLSLVGVPVIADGLVIEIPEGSFEVVEACAGLRFLIASAVFGCFFATLVYRSKLTRIFFILLSILVPILGNGVRVFGLILLAHFQGNATAIEADHVIYGWAFFSLLTLFLIAIGLMLPDRLNLAAVRSPENSGSFRPSSGLRVGVIVGAALAIIAVGPVWLRIFEPASAAPIQARLADLAPGTDWVKAPDDPAGWWPLWQGADQIFPTTYRDGDMSASAYIVRYRVGFHDKPISRMLSAIADPEIWKIADTGRVFVPIEGQTVAVNTAMLRRQGFSRSVWWFYVIDGQVTASSLEARLLHARAALLSGQHVQAFVAISAAAIDLPPDNSTLRTFLKSFHAQQAAASSPSS